MTTPLIIQIQEAALDGKSSLTEALRKAKVACAKLQLLEFGKWVDDELNGYMAKNINELPPYRKLHGTPEALNTYRGWIPIQFASAEEQVAYSHAPLGMSIGGIEDSLREAKAGDGTYFAFPYPPEIANGLRDSLNYGDDVRIRLDKMQIREVLHAVRNILLNWTLDMEREGIKGDGLMFSDDEKKASAAVTQSTVNHIHIDQVGAFVQNADASLVQGGISTSLDVHSVRNLVQQVEQLLPAANLEKALESETQSALDELKDAAQSQNPDTRRLRRGLESLKRVPAPAGETLLKIAVDTAVKRLLGQG
jgi:hypothetical protein